MEWLWYKFVLREYLAVDGAIGDFAFEPGSVTAVAAVFLVFVTAWLAWETWRFRRETTETAERSVKVAEQRGRIDAYPAVLVAYAVSLPGEPISQTEYFNRTTCMPAHQAFNGLYTTNAGRGPAILGEIVVPGYQQEIGLDQRHLPPGGKSFFPCKCLDSFLKSKCEEGEEHIECTITYHDLAGTLYAGTRYTHHFRLKLKVAQVVPLHTDVEPCQGPLSVL